MGSFLCIISSGFAVCLQKLIIECGSWNVAKRTGHREIFAWSLDVHIVTLISYDLYVQVYLNQLVNIKPLF